MAGRASPATMRALRRLNPPPRSSRTSRANVGHELRLPRYGTVNCNAPRQDEMAARPLLLGLQLQSFSTSGNKSLLKSRGTGAKQSAKSDGSSQMVDLLVEFVSRIEQSENAIRSARMPNRSAKLASSSQPFRQQRALKAIASDLCRSYMTLDPIYLSHGAQSSGYANRGGDREAVLQYLTTECGTDNVAVEKAANSYLNNASSTNAVPQKSQMLLFTKKLREACDPKYLSMFNRILSEANRDLGMAFLIQLRYDARLCISNIERGASSKVGSVQENRVFCVTRMQQMDSDLRSLLSNLFLQPILELRRIAYDTTPASIIEKIALKEAVHPLRSLDDLRTRLGPSRRCYAFFHPSIPNEPLVFVHVALLPSMPETMEDIESEENSDTQGLTKPNAAAFYSITNTQPGLSGVDLGNFLIKRVVEEVQSEFLSIETFCTLSPIPRLMKWIEGKLQSSIETTEAESKSAHDNFLSDCERKALMKVLKCPSLENVPQAVLAVLKTPWDENDKLSKALKPVLMRLAAQYLVHEKHRGRPLDGVAKFHIRNGAEMYRLNYLADKSRKGMHNSAGMMINYRYVLESIEDNNVSYEAYGHIPVREGVTKWLGNSIEM